MATHLIRVSRMHPPPLPTCIPSPMATTTSHLSWTDTKPCVVVNSQWEDNSYRIHFLNILLTISDSLASGISASKNLIEEEGSQEEQVKAKLVETVEHFLDQIK